MREQIVLLFHGIGEPPAHIAKDERPYWIDRSLFHDIVEMAKSEDFVRDIVFTFDDGNKSDLYAAEELGRAGLEGHFFLLSGRLDQPHFLRGAEARQLAEAGMEIGLHGHSHVKWRNLDAQTWHKEVHQARSNIEDEIGCAVKSVALPYGWYDRAALRRLERDGFHRIYTTDPGPSIASSPIVRRTAITTACSLEDVRSIIEDNIKPLSRARRMIAPLIKSWR